MTDNMPPSTDKTEQANRRVGAYAKLLANYASDDAIIDAGEAAELLFVRGLAFCATSDSDGFITDAQVTRYVGAGMRDAPKRARRLAEVGVWERLDGGYLVRSWTKIHETAADKGRRRKADRERKRKDAESNAPSEPIPGGIQTEGVADSLSMTEQCSDTTAQSTTAQVEVPSGGERNETLPASDATKPPTSRCTKHRNGNPTNEPCFACKADREYDDRIADRQKREADQARRDCTECGGTGWLEHPHTGLPAGRCTRHRRTA